MHVVEIETQDHQERYVVIDDEGVLVEPIMRYAMLLPGYLPLCQFYRMFVREARDVVPIAYNLDHCAALPVNEVGHV